MNSIVELQIVGVIGLVGNGLSMLIFYRQRVHKIFHNLLLTLAIFDTVCIRILNHLTVSFYPIFLPGLTISGLRRLLHPAILHAQIQRGVRQQLPGPRPALHVPPGLHRADGQRLLHHRHRRRALPRRHLPLLAEEVSESAGLCRVS